MKIRIQIFLSPQNNFSESNVNTLKHLPKPISNAAVIEIVKQHSNQLIQHISLN